jgi:hypothetical protein
MKINVIVHKQFDEFTSHSKSKQFFNARDVNPIAIQGIGQGNGAGPQIWAAISTAILNLVRTKNAGGSFRAPITKELKEIVGFAFVDNTDLIIARPHEQQEATAVLQQMQMLLQAWEGGIGSSGGQLEPTKTFWYLIDFEWEAGKWRYKKTKSDSTHLHMTAPDGKVVQIEQVEVNVGRRTLGVRLAPDGNAQAEIEYLSNEADAWAEKIRTGMLPKQYT